MKAYFLSREQRIGKYCQFEFWDNKKKAMVNCNCVPIATIGSTPVCLEHLPDALIRTGNLDLYHQYVKNKTVESFWCKEDFLKYCKENE